VIHGVNFADVERDFVRARVYPHFQWRAYDAFSPLNPLRVPLQSARVAFVTTSGAHLADQPSFDITAATGDPSFRSFPSSTPLDQIRLSHRGYNTRRASADKNVVVPLDHLRAAAADARMGGLSPTVYSFMGYIANTEVLLEHSAPMVAASLASDGADLVLLAPT
jgi:Glycine/sarcosine/betaine reductase selenoprotein B (GRDB)